MDILDINNNYRNYNNIILDRDELHSFLKSNSLEFFMTSQYSNKCERSEDGKWCYAPASYIDEEMLEFIFTMSSLKVLKLDSLELNTENLPTSFSQLTELRLLSFTYTPIKVIPDVVQNFKKLEILWIGGTQVKELPQWISGLKELRILAFWRTGVDRLPSWIYDMDKMEALSFSNTSIDYLPEDISKLKRLNYIALDNTYITKLPKNLPVFSNLEFLDLSNLTLEEIPEWVFLQNLPFFINEEDYTHDERGILLFNTRLYHQPLSLFETDREFIRAYYKEEKVRLNEVKLVFLGDGEAGKSHIIERIKNDGALLRDFRKEVTPGIEISKLELDVNGENMRLQFWDFGGQEILHSMHRFFLTERTLYIVVLNCRDNTQDQRAAYWLNNIKSFADGCPVILVLNKLDQNSSAGLNETSLRNEYPLIKNVIKMSAKYDNKEVFNRLLDDIKRQVSTFDSYGMDFPKSWDGVKAALLEMENSYITDGAYRAICDAKGIKDRQIQDWLLEWFHDLGVSFYYRRMSEDLREYMVLKPQWITNAVNILIFNGHGCSANGIITRSDIEKLLARPPKSVVKGLSYTRDEIPFILAVMRRFEISYGINGEYEFIPALCDKNENPAAYDFYSDTSLEYHMEYSYLPDNVLHKLMIRMYNELNREIIWKTGAIFNGMSGMYSALIKIARDSAVLIYVKSTNNHFAPPHIYLGFVRDRLMEINRELGLEANDVIIFKRNDKQEKVPYCSIIKRLKKGKYIYFSDEFEEDINIGDILRTVEGERGTEVALRLCRDGEIETIAELRSSITIENTVRWLHISDIHFNYAPATVELMREKLLAYLPRKAGRLDYIFITGDLRFRDASYDGLMEFVINLKDALSVDDGCIFIVPGNHDIDRSDSREDTSKGVKSHYSATQGEISEDRLKILLGGQIGFNDMYRQITKVDYEGSEKPHFVKTTDKVNVLHLNTALTSSKDGDDGTLILGMKSISEALKDCDRKKPTIALAHHAFECLEGNEQRQLEIYLKQYGTVIYLCGHFHKTGSQAITRVNQMDNLFEFLCGTNMDENAGEESTDMDVFIGQMNLENHHGYIEAHKWVPDSGIWVLDADFALPQKETDGRLYFPPAERNSKSLV